LVTLLDLHPNFVLGTTYSMFCPVAFGTLERAYCVYRGYMDVVAVQVAQ